MKIVFLFFALIIAAVPAWSQSRDQNFPTPIRTNEISSQISARDVGDARLTQHFYVFAAENGDLNLAVETNNFNGDIDLFEANTLRPLGKVTIYADSAPIKSNRVFYFRKPEQIILRVEGRTPNDEPAFYRINFSGSFAAATNLPDNLQEEVETPKIKSQSSEAVARVNSAGAILEVLPVEETRTDKIEDERKVERKVETPTPKINDKSVVIVRRPSSANRSASNTTAKPRPNQPKKTTRNQRNTDETNAKETSKNESGAVAANNRKTTRKPVSSRKRTAQTENLSATSENAEPNLLVNIRLIVTLKNKTKYERPMTEILHLNVDKGQITVVTKNGEIERFDLLKVEKMSIEQN